MSKYSQKVQDALNKIASGKLIQAETVMSIDAATGKRIVEFRGPPEAHFTVLTVEKGDASLDVYNPNYAELIDYIFEKQPDGSWLGIGNAKGWVSATAYLPNP
jgi:hypothetical protein